MTIELVFVVMYSANVRDHRWLPVARFLLRSVATRRKRDAGSHSVDRIVRVIFRFLPTSANHAHQDDLSVSGPKRLLHVESKTGYQSS